MALRGMKKQVTVQDIAEKLNLSRNTVSKVLNNRASVAEETKKLVLDKALELGYQRPGNPFLPGEAHLPAGSVGVLTPIRFVETSYWARVSRGIEDVLSALGHNVLFYFVKSDEQRSVSAPRNLDPDHVSGLIVSGVVQRDYLAGLQRLGLPMVSIDSYADVDLADPPTDVVLMENRESVGNLTRRLIDAGHERIGFIGGRAGSLSFRERWLGYREALRDADLEPHLLVDSESGYVITDTIAEQAEFPSAIVCANDRSAIIAIKQLSRMGVRVPDDIAITGFDDISESTIVEPNLTTVHVFPEELGRRAVLALLQRIEHPHLPREVVRIGTRLEIRRSA